MCVLLTMMVVVASLLIGLYVFFESVAWSLLEKLLYFECGLLSYSCLLFCLLQLQFLFYVYDCWSFQIFSSSRKVCYINFVILLFYLLCLQRRSFGQGKRRMNKRTSLAQKEDVIRRTVYVSEIDQQVKLLAFDNHFSCNGIHFV